MNSAYEQIKILSQLTHGKKIISEQGLEYFVKWVNEFKSNTKDPNNGRENRAKKRLLEDNAWKDFDTVVQNQYGEGKGAHPKLVRL